jgi:hypothetical protein
MVTSPPDPSSLPPLTKIITITLYIDGNIQLPISPPRNPPPHLHLHLHPLRPTRSNGQKQRWHTRHILEMRQDRGEIESVC